MLKYMFDPSIDNYYGHADAPVELIQYGDFQCEYCAAVYPEIKMLQERMGNSLKFVFRHFPQLTLHRLSLDAAIAAEAASRQDKRKFWPMHDMIFENQKYLTLSSFCGFAEEIGLNSALFEDSRTAKKLIQKVTSDYESGVNSGVSGTPTFFINGYMYNGFHDFDNLYKTCNYLRTLKNVA